VRLPSSERVAQELALQETEVQSALARLLIEGLLAVRDGGRIRIASRGPAKSVGDFIGASSCSLKDIAFPAEIGGTFHSEP